ncbi:hypothetical protein B0H13DRAFT_2316176 [Mycena leptocephala]|nr:hypothetical protein B0H13DRAFT_2316176 [Mycena leptocephala]
MDHEIDPATVQKITRIVAAAGEERLAAYIDQTFPPELVSLGYHTVENAATWLDIDQFMRWLSRTIQSAASSSPSPSISRTPSAPRPVPLSTPISRSLNSLHASLSLHQNLVDIPDSDGDDLPPAPLLKDRKRKHSTYKVNDVISVSSDSEAGERSKSKKKGKKHLPKPCWTVPRPEEDYAYLLDLSDDPREWVDKKKKEPLSMIAIIKLQDQDAWGEGTGGSISKPTNVVALGGVACQAATHQCQGVWICDQFDHSLLDGHERYEPDDDAMRELWEADRAVNVRDTSSMYTRVAAFYNEVHRKKCKFVGSDGVQCTGAPVYRKLKQMNFDGKNGFIGCEHYAPGESHRFVTINRDIEEKSLIELFQNKGQFTSFVNVVTANCARILPPRQGGKGERVCSYPHIDSNGIVVKGRLIRRKCNTIIKIFAPIDRDDRRAIVYLSGAHNHPRPPSSKLTRTGKDMYTDAIVDAGTTGLTVLKCDNAASTSKIFAGNIPAALDPALANPRIKRKLIYDLKTVDNPHGLGFEGVCFLQKKMQETLPADKRYIQSLTSENGIEVILTMLPFLAGRLHAAKASLHDNTYARVHGQWKEWEVVIWDDKIDFHTFTLLVSSKSLTPILTTNRMWTRLWDTIHRVTGVEVKFKFIHGEGLRAVLVDGNKPQANTFGADLVNRNKPHLSGIYETEPMRILSNILRTCTFHINQKFASMAKVVPDEEMGRIRRCLYLKTPHELDELIEWCKKSEHKVVRDWVTDKESIKAWFWPSINEFLSSIPKEDWYLTPGDTNLNESAHPYTNQHTGTNLPLLEAIQRAYKLDLEMEAKIKLMEENCVLVNHRNSKALRDRNNASRRASHHQQALDRISACKELEEIDEAMKALKEKKKAIQQTTGVKKVKKQGEKEKVRAADENELAGTVDDAASSDPKPTDLAGTGLAPVPASYAEQAEFLSAPLQSSVGIQLEPELEPIFPPDRGIAFDYNLEGELADYLYPF